MGITIRKDDIGCIPMSSHTETEPSIYPDNYCTIFTLGVLTMLRILFMFILRDGLHPSML
jgi:hypothetical protein